MPLLPPLSHTFPAPAGYYHNTRQVHPNRQKPVLDAAPTVMWEGAQRRRRAQWAGTKSSSSRPGPGTMRPWTVSWAAPSRGGPARLPACGGPREASGCGTGTAIRRCTTPHSTVTRRWSGFCSAMKLQPTGMALLYLLYHAVSRFFIGLVLDVTLLSQNHFGSCAPVHKISSYN